jgi:hypothetical protein
MAAVCLRPHRHSPRSARLVQEGIASYPELLGRFDDFQARIERAFDVAAEEPKIRSAAAMVARNSAPLAEFVPGGTPSPPASLATGSEGGDGEGTVQPKKKKKSAVMRKLMTRVMAETLELRPNSVYIGEDVEHGGYYLVVSEAALPTPLTLSRQSAL